MITIDGPAGAGKSTAARVLAERLGYTLIPTGAMYRALALSVMRSGVPVRESAELLAHLAPLSIAVKAGRVSLDGEDVTEAIRSREVAQVTSNVTTLAAVRAKVTPLQRQLAAKGGVVLEGRDTGTVVCPHAEVKFYLTASLEARARRRQAELAAAGTPVALAEITSELAARDRQDETRELSPLRRPPGAIELDTSDLTVDQVVERLLVAIEHHKNAPGPAARWSWFYAAMKIPAVALMRLLFRVEAIGREHIPEHGPVLLVANHSSVLDPPLIGGVSDRQLTYLAKAELFEIPLFGALIHGLKARPTRREGADPGALRTARRVLEERGALLVFPEGTRGDEGDIRPAKPGAGLLAVSSGATVVPVYVRGSGRAWPRGRRLPRPAKVTVTFGKPLRFEAERGADRKAQYEIASREMMDAISRLRDGMIAGTAQGRPESVRVVGRSGK
ncbi:MAG: (d)CMP kinase [Candidatus Rokuibacteriota bacterium]|nr:MAG: (d)CMP kinase [Candidatus Rokubacteria bacterium]